MRHTNYKEDYAQIANRIRKISFDATATGVRSNIYSYNEKDRFGASGLVSRGLGQSQKFQNGISD